LGTIVEGDRRDWKFDIGKCILTIDGIEPHAKAPRRKGLTIPIKPIGTPIYKIGTRKK
jgi:hypothetical protein